MSGLFSDIEQALAGLLADVADWREASERLQREATQLQAQGATEAKPHYKAGRYLYLIHPQRDGQRIKEYVGADPLLQQAALNRLKRWERLTEVRAELAQIERAASALSRNLRYSSRSLW
jgi:hypothetical protein